MQSEWRTTDSNTTFGECDACHSKRPVKKMVIPLYLDDEDYTDNDELDENYFDDWREEIMQFYCLSCYKAEELEERQRRM